MTDAVRERPSTTVGFISSLASSSILAHSNSGDLDAPPGNQTREPISEVSGKAWGSPDGKRSLFTQLRRHGGTFLDTPRLVSDLLWEQEAAGSNPAIPTHLCWSGHVRILLKIVCEAAVGAKCQHVEHGGP